MKKKILICSILIVALIVGVVAIPAILHRQKNEVSANDLSNTQNITQTELHHPEYMAYDTLADFLNNDDFDKYWYFKSENYDLVTVHKKIVVPVLPNEYGSYKIRVWGDISYLYAGGISIEMPLQYVDNDGKNFSQVFLEVMRREKESYPNGESKYNKNGVEFFVIKYSDNKGYRLYTLSPINSMIAIYIYTTNDMSFIEKFINEIQFVVIDVETGLEATPPYFNTSTKTTKLPTETDTEIITSSTEITMQPSKGDINGDYETDIEDLLLLKKHTLKLIDLTGDQLTAADLTGDGEVDVEDLLLLKKIILKIE